ncbi:MAG TPA: glycosyltransferase family 2 protein [Verrucomicrobiae bacterium]|nr:glycosyltransferase family 2 protein [Verrucomicrobiae bacterium]
MMFSIVTPSFQNNHWLKLCIASVADQAGTTWEHIVQDAGSDDGTLDWLPQDKRVKAFVEKDAGMYDAINRGWRRAQGDLVAFLNCDEQYLPGALARVGDYFAAHPNVDVVIADALVLHPDGTYLCHRFAMKPYTSHLWFRFPVLTCATFLRRRVLEEKALWFDPRWRAIGDLFWVKEMVARGVRFGELRAFTSIFTETGANLGLSATNQQETQLWNQMTPRWARVLKPMLIAHHQLRMIARGAFQVKPFRYAIHTAGAGGQRQEFQARHPTPLWHGRR